MKMRNVYDERTNDLSLGRIIFYGFIIIILLGVFTAIGTAILAPINGASTIVNRTLNGDSIIENYEWFKQTVRDVEALDRKIVTAERTEEDFKSNMGPKETWTYEDRQELARLSSIVMGLKSQRADVVAQYNARSHMKNRSLWKTDELPYELN